MQLSRRKLFDRRRMALPIGLVLAYYGLSALIPAYCQSDLFSSKCSGCHTIGGGKGVGPDLAPTKDWPDDKLKAAVEKMAPMAGGLSPEEVTALVSYLRNPVEAERKDSEKAGEPAAQAKSNSEESEEIELPGSIEEGRLLFLGLQPLENGGMSCISCHQGGSAVGLGPDLSGISSKYKGRALVSACKQAPFKVMQAAYRSHPITESEALNLAKYLDNGEKNKQISETENYKVSIPVMGGGGALAVLAIIALGYRNRNRGIRQKLKRK